MNKLESTKKMNLGCINKSLIKKECLHNLFEEIVDKYPENVAILFNKTEITYKSLDIKANQLANYLIKKGLKVGNRVGIILDKSAEMYCSILAVLKAGGTYVPIDPTHPKDRIDYIIKDCDINIVISSSSIWEKMNFDSNSVILDNEFNEILKCSPKRNKNKDVGVTNEHVAYIIYTSGSTGRPKGVMIRHKSVSHEVRASQTFYKVKPADKVYQGFTIAFDAAVEEVWMALSNGATLVPATKEMAMAGIDLPKLLNKVGITVLSCTPTLLSMMEDDIRTLRLLIVGGEECPVHIVNKWAKHGRIMYNTYGPTEATVIASYAKCCPNQKVTIGKPLPNYSIYILDEDLNEVPAGEAGELCIGGIGLSSGYVNRDDLTEEKFIKNRFKDELNSPLLYRTGDLAKFDENGNIEFLGRIDTQVKIRGFRIELSEIESILCTIPNVQTAVATVFELSPGVQSLVAFIIPKNKDQVKPSVSKMKKILSESLPTYMIPKYIEVVDSLPTSPSGKVDRKRLPLPKVESSSLDEQKSIVKAENEAERIITSAFKEVFNLKEISVTDNFFEDLGGHSLFVAKTVSLLRKNKGMERLSTSDIYNCPTVRSLAKKVNLKAQHRKIDDNANAKPEDCKPKYAPSSKQHKICGISQALAIYIVYILTSLPIIYVTLYSVSDGGLKFWSTNKIVTVLVPIIIVNALYLPFTLLLSIVAKWLIIGRFKEGSYKVWGGYYFRWWAVMLVQRLTPVYLLNGTPIMSIYLRLMGAKIGKDVYISTNDIRIFDLLSIGDNSSIGMDSQLLGYTVEHGMLTIGKIQIGNECFVGSGSILSVNTKMEDSSVLLEQSMLESKNVIPKKRKYAGSPAKLDSTIDTDLTELKSRAVNYSNKRKLGYSLLYIAIITVTNFIPLIAQIPSITVLVAADIYFKDLFYFFMPLAAVIYVLLLSFEMILIKKLIIGKIKPDYYKLHTTQYLKKWTLDLLMTISLIEIPSLYATVYTQSFLRGMGAKLGKNVEVSTVTNFVPDLITIDKESFVADAASVGTPRVYKGVMKLASVKIGSRTFIGNSAIVPINKNIGNNCLLGVLSVPIKNKVTSDGTSWLGSPPIFLPKRDINEDFSSAETYNPPKTLLMKRYIIEFFRVILPSTADFLVLSLFYRIFLSLSGKVSNFELILLFPLMGLAISLLLATVIAFAKYSLVGIYKTDAKPLWSTDTWKSELITALYETVVVSDFLEMFLATPFASWILRLFGVRIGEKAFIDTTFFSEFDLVRLGDNVSINYNATMQTHLFEDRVMKMSYLHIDDNCSVGNSSVVLYDTKMQEGAILGNLSLLMKGETLPEWTRWDGIPAESTTYELQNEKV